MDTLAVIQGTGFFGEYGQKVLFGQSLEWLFHAASEDAAGPSWSVVPRFSERFKNDACVDIFDFLLVEKKEDKDARKSIVVQITHYPDKFEVQEEPNKTYEALETFEEFLYLRSRALADDAETVGPKVAFVHVLFGNKQRVRQWVISMFEGLLDLCIYPNYSDGSLDPPGMYKDLDALSKEIRKKVTKGEINNGREFRYIQEQRSQNLLSENICKVYGRIENVIRDFTSNGCPLNNRSKPFWTSRLSYMKTEEFQSALNSLNSEAVDGLPSQRPSIKVSVIMKLPNPSIEPSVLEKVVETYERKNPSVRIANDFMTNYEINCNAIANRYALNPQSVLSELWDEPDLPTRSFKRQFVFAAAGLRADAYLDLEGVNEQTFYTASLPLDISQKILTDLESCFPAAEKEFSSFLLSKRKVVEDLVRHNLWNGTLVNPVSDYLGQLLDKAVQDGRISNVIKTYELPMVVADLLKSEFSSKLLTYPEHNVNMNKRAASVRFEYAVPGNNLTCLLKTKYTDAEEHRRSKEEGAKGFLSKLRLLDNGVQFRSDLVLMLLLDGKWKDRNSMTRLIECGWHVYFDADKLIQDIARLTH